MNTRFTDDPYIRKLAGEIIVGSVVALLLGYLFFVMSEVVVQGGLFSYDDTISRFAYGNRSLVMTSIMMGLSFVGKYGVALASLSLLSFYIWKQSAFETSIFFTASTFGLILNLLLKRLYLRPRPISSPLVVEHSYSFPSGHSMTAMVFFMIIVYLYYHKSREIKSTLLVWWLALICVLSIGYSRIYLGVHYASDVIGGFVMGLLWLVLVFIAYKLFYLLKAVREGFLKLT